MVLKELEKRVAELLAIMERLSGLPGFERSRNRYAGALHEVARHRPLSVYELMHCGIDYPEAVRVANATGGERTDVKKGSQCQAS